MAALKLSSLDVNALHRLEKYGEMLRTEDGKFFGHALARCALEAKRVDKLVGMGFARVDVVGKSAFAVFVGKPEP